MIDDFGETLVIGATGRIGAVLRHHWSGGSVRWQARGPRDGFVCFDPLADRAGFLAAARGMDAILCLAGVVNARAGAEGFAEGFDANVTLATATVEVAAQVGARAVLTSSAAVYGAQDRLLSETAPLRPAAEYGRSKARMEQEATGLAQRLGVPVTSLRIGNIAGLDAILGGWRAGFALDRFADGMTPRRSYIGVATLAGAMAAVLRHPAPPEVLNIAEPGLVAMGDLLDGAGLAWTPRAAPESAIPQVELDVSALAAIWDGLPPQVSVDRLIREWRGFQEAQA